MARIIVLVLDSPLRRYDQSGYRSDGIFGPIDDVGRVAEIADGGDLVGRPLQEHEIFRTRSRFVGVEHQDRRAALHQPGLQVPVGYIGIVSKISGPLTTAPNTHLV